MNIKKTMAAITAVLMAGSVFTACSDSSNEGGSDNATTTANNAASNEGGDAAATEGGDAETAALSGSLKVLHNRTDLDQSGFMTELTKGFNELYPDVTVEYESFTSYAEDIATMMQSDNYGDVLMTPQAVKVADYPNFFEPLGDEKELAEKYFWTSNYATGGQLYALATAGQASGIMYNKQVWADAGITELPTTPDEFLACLKQIAENTDAIPYYTNYAAGWTLPQWQSLVVGASGDANYENRLLTDKEDLFYEGSAYDAVYGTMYKIFSDPTLHEADPSTTDWEGCKPAFGEGKIATMVLGSWAITQFQEQAADPSVVGYMPFPYSIDGKMYSTSENDYCMSVNKNSSNKEAAKTFLFWFCTDSGFAASQGMISASRDAEMPETLKSFQDLGVELIVKTAAPDELQGKYDEIAKDSEVDPWGDASTNYKFRMAEAAFAGEGEDAYKAICDDLNAAWAASRDSILG